MSLDSMSFFEVLGFLDVFGYSDHLINGIITTMGLYAFALFFGLALGLVLAIVRHYGGPISSRIAAAYVEFFRGTPLIAQLFAIWFGKSYFNDFLVLIGLPEINFRWKIILFQISPSQDIFISAQVLVAAITLGLNSAAYQAVFFRGSIKSIGGGQMTAARAIGMTKAQGIRYVVLPQSLRRVIPAWSNEAAYLPKYTTAAYLIGIEEIFAKVKIITQATFSVFEVYLLCAVFFLILISIITQIMDRIYEKYKIPGL
ncbi:MAG: amino acid ABC transporter permease [Candidatus Thorarchaeota archaeon]|nr:amino acid ABC transporter permease [Candidatus Thorarchaeota archaeon]